MLSCPLNLGFIYNSHIAGIVVFLLDILFEDFLLVLSAGLWAVGFIDPLNMNTLSDAMSTGTPG